MRIFEKIRLFRPAGDERSAARPRAGTPRGDCSFRFLLIFAFFGISISCFGGPVLKIEAMDFQFGEFPANEAKQGKYILHNIGDKVLSITAARSTCSCAKPEYPKEIAPGKSAEIKLSIGANSYNSKFQGKVYLITNLPEKMVELAFAGEAQPLFIIEPEPEIYIGNLQAGSSYEKEFTVHLKKNGIKFGKPKIEAEFPVTVEKKYIEDKALKVTIKGKELKSKESQLKFTVEIPVLEPAGWPPARFQFQGKINK